MKFIAAEVARQGGGVVTIYNDQLEVVGSRRVYLPGLNELAFHGFIEIARLPKRNLIKISDRWRAVAAAKRAKTLAAAARKQGRPPLLATAPNPWRPALRRARLLVG